jgi:hypothetical protein
MVDPIVYAARDVQDRFALCHRNCEGRLYYPCLPRQKSRFLMFRVRDAMFCGPDTSFQRGASGVGENRARKTEFSLPSNDYKPPNLCENKVVLEARFGQTVIVTRCGRSCGLGEDNSENLPFLKKLSISDEICLQTSQSPSYNPFLLKKGHDFEHTRINLFMARISCSFAQL